MSELESVILGMSMDHIELCNDLRREEFAPVQGETRLTAWGKTRCMALFCIWEKE